MIRFEQVNYTYPSGYEVLKDLNCEINTGEHITVIGKAGAGKTTVFMLIMGLIPVSRGDLRIHDQSLKRMNATELARMRRKMGSVARWLPLINHISALENVIQPLLIGGQNWAVAEKKGKQILAELELGHRYRDEVFTFSDSEYSKLLLARALIHEPDLILIDDSLEHLGPEARQLINQLLKTRLEQGATIIDSVKPTMTLPPHTHRVIELMDARVTDDTEQLYVDISL